jgi:hypothetical protein
MSLLDQPACAMATIDLRVAEARFQGAADALSTLLANIGDNIVAAGIIKQMDECYHNQAIYTRELRRRAEGKPPSQPTCGIELDYVYYEDYYDDTEGKPCNGKGKDTAYPGKGKSSGKGKVYGKNNSSGIGKGKDKNKDMFEIRVQARSGFSGQSAEYYGWVEREVVGHQSFD